MEVWSVLFALFTIFICVDGLYAPVSLRSTTASQSRNVRRDSSLLRPRNQVQLFYADSQSDDISYSISVTAVHKKYKYVLVEDFEHLVSSITCARHGNGTSTLSILFAEESYLSLAKWHWKTEEPLLFVTHHMGCNEDEERGIYKCSVDTFDATSREARLQCSFEVLGDSPHASSAIHIKGSPTSHELRRLLKRRINGPSLSKRTQYSWQNDTTFDFGSVSWEPKETLIDNANGITIYCDNCRTQGQIQLSWDVSIDTDESAIKSAAEDAAAALVTDETEEEAFGNIITNLKMSLETIEAVEADFNFEVVADVTASVSGACCPREGDFNLDNVFTRFYGSGQPNFTLGGWQMLVTRYIGVEADFSVDGAIDVTFPITVKFDQGGQAQASLASTFSGSGLVPEIHFDNPILERIDGTVGGSIAIGAGFALAVTSNNDAFHLTANVKAGLDVPRLSVNATTKTDCVPSASSGATPSALQISYSVSFGLFLKAAATLKILSGLLGTHSFNFDTRKSNSDILKELYHTWDLPGSPKCVSFSQGQKASGLDNDFGVSVPQSPGGAPTEPNKGSPNPPGTIIPNGSLDCSSVQASPGGQPCANAPLQCYSQNVWSCLTGPYAGSSGVVPPGTICACGAFRYPGWEPPTAVVPQCTSGIYCVSDSLFSICSPAGIEPAQAVAPGTVCRNGAMTWP